MTTVDRIVHARTPQSVVVRYERSGKYYEEFPDAPERKRRLLTLSEAVDLALTGTPQLGRAGGMRFDAEIAKRKAAAS